MRVLLSTWRSRGDVEPLARLAVRLREFGAQVRVCAPPDKEFEELLGRSGVPLVPLGPLGRSGVPLVPLGLDGAFGGRRRAAAVAGPICTDGATVAATLLLRG